MLSIEKLSETYNSTQILVILLTRLYLNKQTPAEVQGFIDQHKIDWDLFYKIAAAHHIRAFIYNIIVAQRITIDKQLEARFKHHALVANMTNLHQVKMLNQLLKDFEALGVTAIPYKGVNFASKYYGSLSHREGSDLDFLVPENAVRKLRTYFHEKKYQPKQDVADNYIKYIIATAKELSFKTPVDPVGINCSVEIQWKLIENFVGRFPGYEYFAPHIKKSADKNTQGLQPTYDFICIASHHFVREPLTRFKYLVDMACLITQKGSDLDMPLITKLFQQYGYQNFFNSAMDTLEQLLGVAVPGYTFKGNNTNLLKQHTLAYPVIDKIEFSNAKNLSLLFKFQPNAWAKLRLAARIGWYSLLPGFGDVQEFNMPPYLLPVLFVLRPYRLLTSAISKRKNPQLPA